MIVTWPVDGIGTTYGLSEQKISDSSVDGVSNMFSDNLNTQKREVVCFIHYFQPATS